MKMLDQEFSFQIDLSTTVRLTRLETQKLNQWLVLGEKALAKLCREKIFSQREKWPFREMSFSLLLCGDQKIRQLNAQYRAKNKITDVLSFPHFDNLRDVVTPAQIKLLKQEMMISDQESFYLGDVALCFPQAKRQALHHDISLWDELIHLVFHGALHLIGYDHEISTKEAVLMQKLEDDLLSDFSHFVKGPKDV